MDDTTFIDHLNGAHGVGMAMKLKLPPMDCEWTSKQRNLWEIYHRYMHNHGQMDQEHDHTEKETDARSGGVRPRSDRRGEDSNGHGTTVPDLRSPGGARPELHNGSIQSTPNNSSVQLRRPIQNGRTMSKKAKHAKEDTDYPKLDEMVTAMMEEVKAGDGAESRYRAAAIAGMDALRENGWKYKPAKKLKMKNGTILERAWAELDVIVDRLMSDPGTDLIEAGAADGRDPGRAEGIAFVIAMMEDPDKPDIEWVRSEAMRRYDAAVEEAEDGTPEDTQE